MPLRTLAALVLTTSILAAADEKSDFDRWEKEIAAFEKKDKDKPPPKNAVLFAGSSSIRMWDLAKSFPKIDTINRGFGGSKIADSTHFVPRIITKAEPKTIVFYAGDNDIAANRTPEQVADDFRDFDQAVHKDLPKTRILFIAVKPSPARWKFYEKQQKANALVEEFCKKNELLAYIDVVKPMLGDDGKPKAELFGKDGLHMNEKGYELWNSLVQPHLK